MIVGAAVVELHVHGSQSLKAKRGIVRSISQRVRNRFNLSVAEVGGQGTWQIAVIGRTTVGADPRNVRRVLDRAVRFVEDLHLAEVLDSDVELIELPYHGVSEPGVEDDPIEVAGELDEAGEEPGNGS
jgi:uncharacterized protein YlxP (DUF503 family)